MHRYKIFLITLTLVCSSFASTVFDMKPNWTYPFSCTSTSTAVHAADLNGDLIPDLIFSNHIDDLVQVFLGTGSGSFILEEQYPLKFPGWIETADLDNDSDLDVMVRYNVGGTGYDSLAVFLNDGSSQFSDTLFSRMRSGGAFCVVDFNNDTIQDIVTVILSGKVYLYSGVGDGTFISQEIYDEDLESMGLGVGDIDKDGDDDVVIVTVYTLSFLLNNGDGSVTWNGYYGNINSYIPGLASLTIGNLDNNDTWPDIACCPATPQTGKAIHTFLGLGGGIFNQMGDGWFPGTPFRQTTIEDFNHDGNNDVFCSGASASLLMLGSGDGLLSLDYLNYDDYACKQAAIADLDLDGDIDFAQVTRESMSNNYNIEVYLNKTIQLGVEDTNSGSSDTSLFLEIASNPVSETSEVHFSLPASSNISLIVYDIHGRRLAEIQEGYILAGNHSLLWDTTALPVGCYFLVLQTELGTTNSRCIKLN